MNRYFVHLHPNWKDVFGWSLVGLACISVFAVCFAYFPYKAFNKVEYHPEAAWFISDEEALAQSVVKETDVKGGWKSLVAFIFIAPAFFATLGSWVNFVEALKSKRYVIISAAILQGAATATIAMRADHSMVDSLNHVNYIASQACIDCCREALVETIGWPLKRIRDEKKLAFMVTTVNTRYRHQIKPDELIRIRGFLKQKGPAKVLMRFSLYLPNRKVAVSSQVVLPLVSLETNKAVKIPDWLKKSWGAT